MQLTLDSFKLELTNAVGRGDALATFPATDLLALVWRAETVHQKEREIELLRTAGRWLHIYLTVLLDGSSEDAAESARAELERTKPMLWPSEPKDLEQMLHTALEGWSEERDALLGTIQKLQAELNPEPEEVRHCEACGELLERREKEQKSNFDRRQTCNHICAGILRSRNRGAK